LINTLGAAGLDAAFGAAGLAAGFLSLTGPDGPFGRSKTPLFSPAARARLMWLLKVASLTLPRLLLALMYFLIP
jgi:hypothetical protein